MDRNSRTVLPKSDLAVASPPPPPVPMQPREWTQSLRPPLAVRSPPMHPADSLPKLASISWPPRNRLDRLRARRPFFSSLPPLRSNHLLDPGACLSMAPPDPGRRIPNADAWSRLGRRNRTRPNTARERVG